MIYFIFSSSSVRVLDHFPSKGEALGFNTKKIRIILKYIYSDSQKDNQIIRFAIHKRQCLMYFLYLFLDGGNVLIQRSFHFPYVFHLVRTTEQ